MPPRMRSRRAADMASRSHAITRSTCRRGITLRAHRAEHGRLDVLVNNVWGGYESRECRPLPLVPFWEQSLHQRDGMFTAGVRAHLTASRLAVPLMLPQDRGLIVCTTANLDPLPYLPIAVHRHHVVFAVSVGEVGQPVSGSLFAHG